MGSELSVGPAKVRSVTIRSPPASPGRERFFAWRLKFEKKSACAAHTFWGESAELTKDWSVAECKSTIRVPWGPDLRWEICDG